MKIDVHKMEDLIDRYELKPALQRNCSFLGHSMIGAAYVRDLKFFVGFGYGAIGAYGKNGSYYSMTNNTQISRKVEEFIRSSENNLKQKRIEAMEIYRPQRQRFDQLVNSGGGSLLAIHQAIDIYKSYLVSLGFYNALMRYVEKKELQNIDISDGVLKEIGSERNETASLYSDLEQFFVSACHGLGKSVDFDGDLIRFMTASEFEQFETDPSRWQDILELAKERQEHYFYLLTDEDGLSEYEISNKKDVEEIYKKYFTVERSAVIKGVIAFPGVVRGRVCILGPNIDPTKVNFHQGDILVAVHTHPRYIELVKKSAGIVTDEGGMLSHAAIIARELGKPCIIGTKFATHVLKNGDMIEVDAGKGIVKKLED